MEIPKTMKACAAFAPGVCKALAAGRIPTDVFLTHRWKLEDIKDAYEEVCRGSVIKGLVDLHPETEF